MLFHSVDITAKTGFRVAGPPVAWQTRNGPFTVEHVAAATADGRLIAFWWSPQHDWQAVDITAKTSQHVFGTVAAWQTCNGPFVVEHLAARSPAGDLLVFWWSPAHDWQAVNVSAKTGRKIAGGPAAWQTPNGEQTVEHLAARGPHGELLAFWWSPAHDWQVVDVTAKTGVGVSHDPTAWVTHNGPMLVEHLAAATPGGSLAVFWWSPAHDWQALDVSHIVGGSAAGRAISWQTGAVEHVAVVGRSGELFVYWWTPAANWRQVDAGAICGQAVVEVSGVYQLAETGGNVEILLAKGPDQTVLRFWWRSDRDWQVQDLGKAGGITSMAEPATWTTPNGTALIEHCAVVTPGQALVVLYDDGASRRLTDAAAAPIGTIRRLKGRTPVLAILWDPHRATDPARPVEQVEAAVFGSYSARDFLIEASGGAFTFERAAVLGWFDASRPAEYWWGPNDTNDSDQDGWVTPHTQKWAEAVRLADPQFNFAAYDRDPFDGPLKPDELGILIVIPQENPFGTNRKPLSTEYPQPMDLVVDGVTIPTIVETYIGSPANLGVVAHEFGHYFGGLPDLYFQFPKDDPNWAGVPWDNPFAADKYCLMDSSYTDAHYCAVLKLKLGWLRPRLIARSGRYTLAPVEQQRGAWLLMDPARSTSEYFVIENRSRSGTYDRTLPNQGLAVWHVIEDPAIYGTHIPPVPPDPPADSRQDRWTEKWATIPKGDWGRRGIRLIRPVWDTLRSDVLFAHGDLSLWDGANPLTGYDLLPEAAPPHASLRWADGTPSGFAMRNISPAGGTMSADITVPW